MNDFLFYFLLGRDHILDYANGYDHILFIVALCVIYLLRDWKKVLTLVTFFTLGHSVTLALSLFETVVIHPKKVEFFISMTLFITALNNMFHKETHHKNAFFKLNYAFALFFGLVHGMGFSNYLKMIMGSESHILIPLFAFNLGLELGQLIVIIIFTVVSYLLVTLMRVPGKTWRLIVSAFVMGISLVLLERNIFW